VRFRLKLPDLLVLSYGIISLSGYFYHQPIAVTKYILLFLIMLLYFYFRIGISLGKISRYLLILFLIITALVEAVWGLRQLYGYDLSQHYLFRMTGSFFNPGPYSGYLAVITPLAFYYVLADYKVLKSRFSFRLSWFYLRWAVSILTVICVLLVLPAAMSRASWLAVSGGCGLVAFIYFSPKYNFRNYIKENKKKLIPVIIILLVCIAGGLSGMYYLKKDSADGRGRCGKYPSKPCFIIPWA
jgi:hypothetical protein